MEERTKPDALYAEPVKRRKIYVRIPEGAEIYSMCEHSFRDLAGEAHAVRKVHGTLCMISGGLLSCRKFYKNRKFLLDLTKEDPEVRKTVNTKIRIGRLISFLSVSKCAAITDGIYGWCKNDESKYVSIPSGRKHYFGGMYKRDLLLSTEEAMFEGHKWMVVKKYSEYFMNLYGPKYMELPPEEKREHHVLLELKFPENTEE